MELPPVLSHPAVLLALAILGPLVRDFVVGVLRSRAKTLRADKDPSNDGEAALLEAAAAAIEKARVALLAKKP